MSDVAKLLLALAIVIVARWLLFDDDTPSRKWRN
jgi:hypothetical protein